MSYPPSVRCLCPTCLKDSDPRPFCIYCQRPFASPGRLHRHILTQHEGTIRAQHCQDHEDRKAAPITDEEAEVLHENCLHHPRVGGWCHACEAALRERRARG